MAAREARLFVLGCWFRRLRVFAAGAGVFDARSASLAKPPNAVFLDFGMETAAAQLAGLSVYDLLAESRFCGL